MFPFKRFLFVITLFIHLRKINGYSNDSLITKSDPNAKLSWDNDIWNSLMEEWTLKSHNNRESRVMQIPLSSGQAYVVQDRIDYVKESKIAGGKIINNSNHNNGYRAPIANSPVRPVTETDLYLLSAIEKLVYKVDFMEKRLRRVEEMLYYIMAGNRMDTESCPENFTRAGKSCYMFASNAGREYDWKVANKQCKKIGAVLAEMETIDENQDLVAHIQSNAHLKGNDFWIGGLNPGLLWIWSNSARPVMAPGSQQQQPQTNNNENPSASIQGDGRCLRLAYNPALRSYMYKGTDCSVRYSYICELPENTSSNEIQRIGRNRKIID